MEDTPIYYVSYNKSSHEVKSGQCVVSVCANKGDDPMYAICPEKNIGFVGRDWDVLSKFHSEENMYYTFGRSKSEAKKKLVIFLDLLVSNKEDELEKVVRMRDDVSALNV